MPISAIVLTKNEQNNVVRCLASLHFVVQIVVIDSGSTDATLSLVAGFSNVTLIQTQWFGFSENKKIGLAQCTQNWVFWVDADEEVSPHLAAEIGQLFSLQQEAAAYDLPRKTFFLNTWVRHSGWYPNRVVRLFHKEKAHFNHLVLHEGVNLLPGFQLGHLKNDLLHYSYRSIYQYFLKMNVYGLMGAQEALRRKKTIYPLQLFLQPIWTFIRFYFLKLGFLDGMVGFIVCAGAAFSNFIKYTNYIYLKRYGYVSIEDQHPKS